MSNRFPEKFIDAKINGLNVYVMKKTNGGVEYVSHDPAEYNIWYFTSSALGPYVKDEGVSWEGKFMGNFFLENHYHVEFRNKPQGRQPDDWTGSIDLIEETTNA